MSIVDNMIVCAGLMRRYLTPQMLRDIDDVARFRKPYVLVEGFPILPNSASFATNIALGSISLLSARPVAYKEENSGILIREVRPLPQTATQQSSQGRVDLAMHTDMTFLRFQSESNHPILAAAPDFLILSCVKNDPHVATRIVTLDQIKQALSPSDLSELYGQNFTIRTPDSVTPTRTIADLAILFHHATLGDLIRYNDAYCTGQTPAAILALDSLQAFVRDDQTGEEILLEPGKVLVFNNRQVLHGRGAIPESSDPSQDRWFKRVYAQRLDTELSSGDPLLQST